MGIHYSQLSMDEDLPMLTPEQTMAQVSPTPWFVSYQ